jgi:acyl-coenzyme A thioesterase PaaI-like protein
METNIEFVDAGEGFLVKMPVNASVHQPMGLLHGDCSISRKCGKCGFSVFINAKEQEVRGIEISANHLKYSRRVVTGTTNYSEERCICGK